MENTTTREEILLLLRIFPGRFVSWLDFFMFDMALQLPSFTDTMECYNFVIKRSLNHSRTKPCPIPGIMNSPISSTKFKAKFPSLVRYIFRTEKNSWK